MIENNKIGELFMIINIVMKLFIQIKQINIFIIIMLK